MVYTMICMATLSSCSTEKENDEVLVDHNTSDLLLTKDELTGMTATEMVADMKIGWNLGNTLDVCNADRNGDSRIDENSVTVDETLWGNVMTTKALFESLKDDGINAVRLPVTWRDHIEDGPEYNVDKGWMDRVEEVVGYAYELDMYVIINVHHDGGGDPEFGAWVKLAEDEKLREEIFNKYEKLWTQIANRFQNYSDKLIFENLNEVGFDNLSTTKAYNLLNEFNQRFVDLIRSTGGNNPTRNLLIAGYWTDFLKTSSRLYKMPKDTVENHMILSVHYYTPWQFATTNQRYTWGSEEDIIEMNDKISILESLITSKGVPIIIGEYGFGPNEPESCVYFSEMFVKKCYDLGVATFLWDNGEQYDRTEMYWYNPKLIAALNRATSGIDYDITKGA